MLNNTRLSADQRVLEFIGYSNGIDRVVLARELRLPMPTVISAVKRLLADDAIVETSDTVARPSAGRRPRILRRSGPAPALGLIAWRDAGLSAACYDFAGTELCSQLLPVPDPYAGAGGLAPAVTLLRSVAAERLEHHLAAIVISVPAPFLHGRGAPQTRHARRDGTPAFSVAVGGDLEGLLARDHAVPVVMENDANLAGLGELYAGTGKGARNAVYLRINDRGFGSAIIVNGMLARGAHGYAGELAHLQLDPEGPLCACGGRGCLASHIQSLISERAQPAYDQPITFASLSRLAAEDDPGAARMLADIGRTLGRPLAHLCTFLDPERLILDNTIGPAAEHVLTGLRETFPVQAPPVIAQNVAMCVGVLGPEAEIRGAIEALRERARHAC
jgi:predicted NBD/HSP70 family sugar kinase